MKALIEAGADVNKPSSPQSVKQSGKRTGVLHNATPLYFAAEKGHTHVVMELIKAGADVNQSDLGGLHPALRSRLPMGTRVSWLCSSKPAQTFEKLARAVGRL